MDQNFPMPAHSKYLRVLYHMWEHEEWDLLYLAGFGETLSLIETENAKEASKYALQPETIARVSAAWVNYELDGWHGGFVLELADDRRVYVESYSDRSAWGPGSGASVTPMPAGSGLPELSSTHASKLYGWRYDLPELDEYLRRVRLG